MSEQSGFMRSIIDAPEDDLPRLVFADWLQEHGDEERAEFIRVQCEIDRFPGYPRRMSIAALEHGEIVPQDDSDLRQVEAAKYCQAEFRRLGKLRTREDELFHERAGRWWFGHALHLFYPEGDSNPYGGGPKPGVVLVPEHDYLRAQLVIRRGFIDGLVCRSDDFFRAADKLYWRKTFPCTNRLCIRGECNDAEMGGIFSKKWKCEVCDGVGTLPIRCPDNAQPIRKVTLTDEPQLIFTGDGCFTWEGYPCRIPLPEQQHHATTDPGLKRCLEATFPGIEFTVGNA